MRSQVGGVRAQRADTNAKHSAGANPLSQGKTRARTGCMTWCVETYNNFPLQYYAKRLMNMHHIASKYSGPVAGHDSCISFLIISCRKRRIKCDEAKPQCLRCVSAGRVCGGYSFEVRFVNMPGQDGAINPNSLPYLRSLSTTIEGSDTENQYFFSCRRATEAGFSMHSCSVSSFWTSLAPQLGHVDEGVKHALVALGATYYVRKLKRSGNLPHGAFSLAIKQLESFIHQQYSRAIRHVYGHLEKKEPTSTGLVLVCCLIFISLEFLRSNQSAAMAHLRNGIQIIISALDLKRLSNTPLSRSTPEDETLGLSAADLWGVINQFRKIEFTLNVFSSNVSMILGMHLRKMAPPQTRRTHDTFYCERITSVELSYKARDAYMDDVMTRYSELQSHQGDKNFWEQQHMQRELSMLRERGAIIMRAIEMFWAGDQAPEEGTWSSYSARMDWLLVTTARTFVELIPLGVNAHSKVAGVSYIQDEVARGVSFAARMQLDHPATGLPPSEFSLETGVIALMYWAWVISSRPETKAASLGILQGLDKREGPWDAKEILKSIHSVIKPSLLYS